MQTDEEFMWGGLRLRFERWSTVHPRSLASHFAVVPANAVPRPARGVTFPAGKPAMRQTHSSYPARHG
jgi:hypothetical protein